MSLKKLEQFEKNLRKKDRQGKSKKSSKWYKKLRNKWLRKTKSDEIPDTKLRKGYEF
jgi:hypothetical protein